MSLTTLLACIALAGAIVLVTQKQVRPWAIGAIVAAGLEVTLALRLVRFQIPGVPLNVVLGAILTIIGLVVFFKLTDRIGVASATTITLVGIVQLLSGLGVV